MMGKGVTMDKLVNSLAGALRAPVLDHTGLIGSFDYDVLLSNSPQNGARGLLSLSGMRLPARPLRAIYLVTGAGIFAAAF